MDNKSASSHSNAGLYHGLAALQASMMVQILHPFDVIKTRFQSFSFFNLMNEKSLKVMMEGLIKIWCQNMKECSMPWKWFTNTKEWRDFTGGFVLLWWPILPRISFSSDCNFSLRKGNFIPFEFALRKIWKTEKSLSAKIRKRIEFWIVSSFFGIGGYFMLPNYPDVGA